MRDDLDRCFKAMHALCRLICLSCVIIAWRGWYAERYDVRKQLADMDYHSGLRATASIIHIKQFKEWRVSGIAYRCDHVYTEPNRSLMTWCGGNEKGQGFWSQEI